MSRIFVALRGVLYASLFVLLWSWLAISVQRYDRSLPFVIPGWLRPLGFVIAILGALVALWCIATFVTRGQGTPAPFDPPRVFVATGPYRFVRNPMYIGGFGVIVGAALIMGSPAMLLLALAFLAITHAFVLLYEEPTLEDSFGSSHLHYKATVRRWLPGRPR
jgi:protein-S-isoprenylcysteine O-methyltransferase Ste14